MQVTVTVSDELVRQAADEGQNIVDYVEHLIDKGQEMKDKPAVQDAIAKIRALRAHEIGEICGHEGADAESRG